ncbi:hypothetical protein HK100_005146 [Physocladia obscura]|uniref:GATA-type domain-containing protein n=1 Tax=Physocladia obscura TaxID=109957 RepID=A0AAD5STG6_9FUNG|nr:hypothetical protein HK100_005146 [Physocladia obscura]
MKRWDSNNSSSSSLINGLGDGVDDLVRQYTDAQKDLREAYSIFSEGVTLEIQQTAQYLIQEHQKRIFNLELRWPPIRNYYNTVLSSSTFGSAVAPGSAASSESYYPSVAPPPAIKASTAMTVNSTQAAVAAVKLPVPSQPKPAFSNIPIQSIAPPPSHLNNRNKASFPIWSPNFAAPSVASNSTAMVFGPHQFYNTSLKQQEPQQQSQQKNVPEPRAKQNRNYLHAVHKAQKNYDSAKTLSPQLLGLLPATTRLSSSEQTPETTSNASSIATDVAQRSNSSSSVVLMPSGVTSNSSVQSLAVACSGRLGEEHDDECDGDDDDGDGDATDSDYGGGSVGEKKEGWVVKPTKNPTWSTIQLPSKTTQLDEKRRRGRPRKLEKQHVPITPSPPKKKRVFVGLPAQLPHKIRGTKEGSGFSNTPISVTHFCVEMLLQIKAHMTSIPFLRPVNPVALKIPLYPEVIKHPMDISTIESKLASGKYATIVAYAHDFIQIYENCVLFNGHEHPISLVGAQWKKIVKRQFEELRNFARDEGMDKQICEEMMAMFKTNIGPESVGAGAAAVYDIDGAGYNDTNDSDSGNENPGTFLGGFSHDIVSDGDQYQQHNTHGEQHQHQIISNKLSTKTAFKGKKECSYCFTDTTPTWRHGPAGYHDLCNSCGIQWRHGKILVGLESSNILDASKLQYLPKSIGAGVGSGHDVVADDTGNTGFVNSSSGSSRAKLNEGSVTATAAIDSESDDGYRSPFSVLSN